jgi:hypothetical protein
VFAATLVMTDILVTYLRQHSDYLDPAKVMKRIRYANDTTPTVRVDATSLQGADLSLLTLILGDNAVLHTFCVSILSLATTDCQLKTTTKSAPHNSSRQAETSEID